MIAAGHGVQFAAGVNLVEVYATVTDAAGEAIRGLGRDAFVVEEDGVEQSVSAFAAGELPLALAIGVDRSFSVPKQRLNEVTTAVRGLLEALAPGDRALLLAIGSQPEVLTPLGTDRVAARAALATLDSWGSTPLHDAVATAIDAIEPAAGRRALILLSDGTDRYSALSQTDVVRHAREKDVIVYPVSIGARRPALFAELASVTGGRSFQGGDARALATSLAAIARELRGQYLLGYTPAIAVTSGDPWRTIRVRVRQAGARVRARDGYRARP